MSFAAPRDAIIEVGAKRSRLVVTLALALVGVFLYQLLLSRVNPTTQSVPYFGPASSGHAGGRFPRVAAPDPLAQLLWLHRADALGRLWLWQLLTFGFVHSPMCLWHLIVGLAGLWAFGPEVAARIGGARFLLLYLSAGVFCGLFSVLVAPQYPTLGCVASVLGVVGAFWASLGRSTVYVAFLPLTGKTLALLYAAAAVLVCVAYLPDECGVVYLAHLLGLPYGWVFARLERRIGWYLMLWELRQAERSAARELRLRARVDGLLDKVHRVGMENLTFRERTFLMSASRKFQHWRQAGAEDAGKASTEQRQR